MIANIILGYIWQREIDLSFNTLHYQRLIYLIYHIRAELLISGRMVPIYWLAKSVLRAETICQASLNLTA